MEDADVNEFYLPLPAEFKPTLTFNKSEGFIEAIYENVPGYFLPVSSGPPVTEIRANDDHRLIGWRMELRGDETYDITFR